MSANYGPQLITLHQDAYLRIAAHVLKHAPLTQKKETWKEVYGMCVGRVVVGNCIVTDCVPLAVGVHEEVQLTAMDYVKAADLETQYALRDPPEFFVGWYHSHFIGHTFSGVDMENHLGWQTNLNPHAFGLVFDPALLSKDNPGFCILRLENPDLGLASELEFSDFILKIPKEARSDYIEFLEQHLTEIEFPSREL